ncbi:MAG: ABC-F family ATP-binding cassette domain-containing protein [Candidatus Paceibacterota bacterium]
MFIDNYKSEAPEVDGPLVILTGVAKYFGTKEIFSGVDLVVGPRDRLGIIGPNGAGKSTLTKIIMGLEEIDAGEIYRDKDLRVGYLPQETHWDSLKNTIAEEIKTADPKMKELMAQKTEYEKIMSDTKRKDLDEKIAEYGKVVEEFEKLGGYEYENIAEETLKKFNFPEDDWGREVKSLSGGERTRLALSKILLTRPNLLIMDEPTNHLDLATIEWLEKFLMDWKMAIVIVSHDKRFLDSICTNIFDLRKKESRRYFCNYSNYLIEKEAIKNAESEAFKRQQKYLKEQEEFIERFRYKATKARAVQSRLKLLDKMEKIEEPEEEKKKIRINLNFGKSLPQRVMVIENLFFGVKEYPLAIMEGTWEIWKENKIGIIGANGAGKSTLLKTLLGKLEPLDGKVKVSGSVKIGYYAQSHEELDPTKNIFDEVTEKTGASHQDIRNILGSLLFVKDDVFKNVSDLSGGERARVAIAELILNESNILFLDEPTNHLDIESKNCVIEVLKNFGGPIVLVSHDREVLEKVCNVIWEVKDNAVTKYLGNYDDYVYKKSGMK